MPDIYPNDDTIRNALLARVRSFMQLTGMGPSIIAREAINDPAFLTRVAKGHNLTLRSYQRVMDWLDDNWPNPKRKKTYERKNPKSTRRKRRAHKNGRRR